MAHDRRRRVSYPMSAFRLTFPGSLLGFSLSSGKGRQREKRGTVSLVPPLKKKRQLFHVTHTLQTRHGATTMNDVPVRKFILFNTSW